MGDFPSIPGYSILRVLGEGGVATVYLAVQDTMNREVALKVMHVANGQDERMGERFLREARIVARLTHPHIVPMYDVGKADDYYYLAMEYLPKPDLSARIQQGMTAGQILRVAKSIASALDAAHQKSYIHRDVKPDNILFRDDGTPVLTDFSIAKPITDEPSLRMVDAAHYMSPEQIRGEGVDPSCDLYALGVVIYEMLTGHVPYTGNDAFAVGIKHINDAIPRLPANRAVFQHLIDGLLAKDKSQRIASAKQVVDALDAIYTVLRRQADAQKAQGQSKPSEKLSASQQAPMKTVPTEPLAMQPMEDGSIRADRRDHQQAFNTQQDDDQQSGKNYKPMVAALLLVIAVALSAAIYFSPYFAANTPLMSAHNMLKSLLVPVPKVDVKQEKIDQLLTRAQAAIAAEHYVIPLSDSALEAYRAVLNLDEFNVQAKLEMEAMAGLLLDKANAAIDAGNFDMAQDLLRQVRSVASNAQGLMSTEMRLRRQQQMAQEAERQQRLLEQQAAEEAAKEEELRQQRQAALERQRQQSLKADREAEQAELAKQQAEAEAAAAMFTNIRVRGLLAKADTYYTRGEYHVPVGENALAAYSQVLELDANNAAAQEGLDKTVAAIIEELEDLLANQRVNEAQALYNHVLSMAKDNSALYAFAQGAGW